MGGFLLSKKILNVFFVSKGTSYFLSQLLNTLKEEKEEEERCDLPSE